MPLVHVLVLLLGLTIAVAIGQAAGIVVYAFGNTAAVAVSSGAGAFAVMLGLFFAGVAAFR